MAEQKMRPVLIRQWRLLELVRSSHQGKSLQSLMEELKVSHATLDRDLGILEEAGLPIERWTFSGGTRVLYQENISSPLVAPPLDPSSVVAILNEAIKEKLEVHLLYTLPRTSGAVSFKLAPFLIEEVSKVPYLLAWDLKAEDWRLFEVARIIQAKLGDNHNESGPEEEERLFNELAENLGELISVVVRLTPHGAYLVSDYPLTPTQAVESQPDGGRIIRCQNMGFRDALYWVLSWGPEVALIEPEHLREKVASKLRSALHSHLEKQIVELTAERDLLARGLPSSY